MEEGVIIVDIRTFLRLYVQKKILGTRSECTKSGEIDLYCMTGVFYIWLVKSPTYAMMRVNVSEKDYKNKIDSGSNEHHQIIHEFSRGIYFLTQPP